MNELGKQFTSAFHASSVWTNTTWQGIKVQKCPLDLWLYQELLVADKPDFLIETGTKYGGSASFFADVMAPWGGKVITIDNGALANPFHPGVTYIAANAVHSSTIAKVAEMVAGKKVMVSLDADHSKEYCDVELAFYAPLVSRGCALVLEDTYFCECAKSVEPFLAAHPEFCRDVQANEKFLSTYHTWMRKT